MRKRPRNAPTDLRLVQDCNGTRTLDRQYVGDARPGRGEAAGRKGKRERERGRGKIRMDEKKKKLEDAERGMKEEIMNGKMQNEKDEKKKD